MLLHWNITRSVFSMFSSTAVTYFTDSRPFTGMYSIRNSLRGPCLVLSLYLSSLSPPQLLAASMTMLSYTLGENSLLGLSWMRTLQKYLRSGVFPPSISPRLYWRALLWGTRWAGSPLPWSLMLCSTVMIWFLMNTSRSSSMARSISWAWVSTGPLRVRACARVASRWVISLKMALLRQLLTAEKRLLFMTLTRVLCSRKSSLSSRERMTTRGCGICISCGSRQLRRIRSSDRNCLARSLSAGFFRRSNCGRAQHRMAFRCEITQRPQLRGSYVASQCRMNERTSAFCCSSFSCRKSFSRMYSMQTSGEGSLRWGCSSRGRGFSSRLIFFTWQVNSRQASCTPRAARERRSGGWDSTLSGTRWRCGAKRRIWVRNSVFSSILRYSSLSSRTFSSSVRTYKDFPTSIIYNYRSHPHIPISYRRQQISLPFYPPPANNISFMHRLSNISEALGRQPVGKGGDSLQVVDNRTRKTYHITLTEAKDCYFLKTKDMASIVSRQEVPLRLYDPGYMHTICNRSSISYIDGQRGVLEYRGYPIEQLADRSSFVEVAFLLIYGELPGGEQLNSFSERVMQHAILHADVATLLKSYRHDAQPMGMLMSLLSAYSTLHPEANPALQGEGLYKDIALRNTQVFRLLGSLPTLAANCYRKKVGRGFQIPAEGLGFVENFLYMLDTQGEDDFRPHPILVKALEVLFILHAEHEMSCSTAALRHIASAGVDLYSAVAAAAGALSGPKHGGANGAVIGMLESIGTKDNIRRFLMEVKQKRRVLFGFGNRVYKSYDPRAKIVKRVAESVFALCGKEPLIELALELERIALGDQYFLTRKLYPNVDFYSGLIYRAMGFSRDIYPVLYAIPRMAGWLAHWTEVQSDPQQRLVRPRQYYKGYGRRLFQQLFERRQHPCDIETVKSKASRRREAAERFATDSK